MSAPSTAFSPDYVERLREYGTPAGRRRTAEEPGVQEIGRRTSYVSKAGWKWTRSKVGLGPTGESRVKTNWAEVYEASYPELFRFVHRKVWDEERAKDLVQEAFARAMEHKPEKPRAWLFQVLANLARDEARLVVRRKRHLALLKAETDARGHEAPSADEDLDRRRRMDRVRAALDSLSERDRDVILLWDAGLNYQDIAAQTGLSKGAIGTTIARAKRKLGESYHALEARDAALG